MRLWEIFTEKWVYVCAALRLVVIPMITLIFLCLVPNIYRDIKLTVLVAASAPAGSNVAFFAQLNGLDYRRAVKGICMTTLFSIITMPIILLVAQKIWI